MTKLALVTFAVFAACAGGAPAPEPEAPPPRPPPPLVHRVEWRGQTLEQIAGWYTGKKSNWEKLTKPVNPDLERCCVPLKVGREVSIPSTLLVTVDPMPKPKKAPATPTAKKPAPKAEPVANAEAADEPVKEPEPNANEPAAEAEKPEPAAKEEASATGRPGPASGKVSMRGEAWAVADAIAYPDDDQIEVALSSKPFDRKAFAKDGKIDSFDVMRHNGMESASSITLKLGADDSVGCIDFATQSGGGSSCNSAISEGFKLTTKSAEKVAGSLRFVSGEDAVDVRFDVPVTTKVERGGSELPAGGGDPGEAALANFAAIHAGDYDTAKSMSPPEQRKAMEANEAESKEMFELMKAITPTDVEIGGGRLDGDTAVLDFTGKSDGEPVEGTIEMKRIEGKWYVDSLNSSH